MGTLFFVAAVTIGMVAFFMGDSLLQFQKEHIVWLIFLGLVPVVTGTSGSAESERKMTKDNKKEIAMKVRSLATHKRWLNQYASNYTVKVNLYKTHKTREASEEAFQFRDKIMHQQEKMLDILQELRELNEDDTATYTKQESEGS